jgi:outer membrane protein assembly factor BamB
VWGERIFLTTSEPVTGGKVARYVIALARDDGKLLWKKLAATAPGEDVHKMNTWATPTCATDGEVVVAYFGPGGLHGFDVDGNRLWAREKLVEPVGEWGFAGSPILDGNLAIQNCDAEGDSFLLAVNKKTGDKVWRTPRRATPKGGWSTPLLIDTGKRRELILNGEYGVDAYDPATGKSLWFCQGFNGRGEPMPAYTHGLLVTVNGKTPGDVYAVRPGGNGDVTKTHMAWHTPRTGNRDVPSPVAVGDYVFAVSMTGIASLYHATTGKELWRERLGGNYSGTPFVADGLIYLLAEEGSTLVIRPGEKLDVVAKNSLASDVDEIFRASPTPSRGQILLRSQSTLYCVGSSVAE